MRLVLTQDDRIGVERDGSMVDVSAAFADIRYRSAADRMPRVLGAFNERRTRVEELAASGRAESMPALQAPVPRPPKLIAAFGNYREGSDRERQTQDMFLESPDSVIGPGGTVILPNHPATIFHHEAELALVVGQRAKDLPADERALEALVGYTCAIDVSARGMGRIGPSRIGKSFDTFKPLGPAIVTTDEVPDPQNLQIKLWVNSELKQNFNTSDMAHKIPRCIEWVSSIHAIEAGDILATGTNHRGLSAFQDGDVIEIETEKLGRLTFNVKDDLKRTWGRDTRLDRQNAKQEGQTPQLTGKYAKA